MYSGLFFVQVLVDLFLAITEGLLGIRVLFRLFDANAANSFVHWIYQTTDVLLAPFRGIFPTATVSPGHYLDITALFAMMVYAVIGYLILALIGMVPAPAARNYRSYRVTRRTTR